MNKNFKPGSWRRKKAYFHKGRQVDQQSLTDVKLLIGSEFLIGKVRVKGHDLCSPCKYLQESLEQKNLVKEMLRRAGLRCEIVTSGKIFVGDEIKVSKS